MHRKFNGNQTREGRLLMVGLSVCFQGWERFRETMRTLQVREGVQEMGASLWVQC